MLKILLNISSEVVEQMVNVVVGICAVVLYLRSCSLNNTINGINTTYLMF